MQQLKRCAMIGIGTLCVVLGVIGIVLPLLPTTPFLVLAAALYARSSPRFHDWLLSRKHLGEYIRAYQEGRGMSAGAKASSLTLLWLTLGSSALFAVEILAVRLLLLAIGLGVTTHLLWIPTYGRIALPDRLCAPLTRRRCTLALGSTRALDATVVGGKAASLSWLMRAGYPVPAGFVITPGALAEHLARSGFPDAPGSLDDSSVREVIQRIVRAPLPEAVERQIREHYQALGGPAAVRSSATCEDTAWASCAGLLRTELNVEGDSALLQAVRRCWSSLYAPSVRSYLQERSVAGGVAPDPPTMAVVVQQMVSPRAAGVAFTADPTSGARHIVVECAPGLGDAVVGGSVTPQRYVLEPGGALLHGPPSETALLPPQVLAALAEALWDIDEARDAPQDVEWAWDGEQLWFLQCRPISTLHDKRVYTSRLAAEMSPGIIKPLVWSVNTSRVPAAFDRAFLLLTGRNEPECYRMITLLHSRLYLDIGVFRSLLQRLGMPPNLIRGLLYGHGPGERERHGPRFGPGMIRQLPRTTRLMWYVTRAMPAIEAFLVDHEAALAPLRAADLASYEPDALLDATGSLMEAHAEAQWYTKIAAVNLLLRNAFLKRIAGRCAPQVDPGDLLLGLSGERSLQSGVRLRDLSRTAARLPEDERQRLLSASDAVIREALQTSDTGRHLLDEMDAYMQEYGFLNSNGTDFSRTPWIEQPTIIWRAVARGIGSLPKSADWGAAERRDRAQERLLRGQGPLVRAMVDRTLASTRRYLALKERCSLLMSEDSYHMHRIATQLGRHLVALGALEEAEDVFCLALEEIQQLFESELSPDEARHLVAERRAVLEADASIEPPEIIYGEWQPASHRPSAPKHGELHGIGASPGSALGCARVVMDPSAVPVDVRSTDILIVPFTDVGWMPLFSGIGGIVTEHGGQLSHSAIVAREFGVPAVIGVERATRLIRDGQAIRIDGALGVVHLT